MAYTLRNYRSSDATNVVMLLNTGRAEPCASVNNAGNIRLIRYVPLSSNRVVMEDSLGKIVGYAYIADKESGFIFEVGGGVHPDHRNTGIDSTLIDWAHYEIHLQDAPIIPVMSNGSTIRQFNVDEDWNRYKRTLPLSPCLIPTVAHPS